MVNSDFYFAPKEIRILVVEDDLEQLELLKETLERSNYTIDTCTDGSKILDLVTKYPDIIILLDYNLQDRTGDEMIRNVIDTLGRKPYFIVMTAYGNEKVAVKMMKLGALDYLVKDPHFYEFLPAVVNNAVNTVIRDRKLVETENSLKEINGRFLGLFQNSKDAIYFTSVDGKFLAFNPAMLEMFGYSSDEMKTLNSSDLYYYHEDRDKFKKEISKTGAITNYEVVLRKKDETPINCIFVTSAKYNNYMEVIGYDGIIHDITERKTAEKKIKESEERYRNLFERVPVGVYRSTPDGKVLDANPALIKILGADDYESILNINVIELYKNPFDRISWKSFVDNSEILYNYEVELKTLDDRIIWVNDSSRVYKNAENEILYYEGVLEDVTDKKRDKEKMKELLNDLISSKSTIETQLSELNKLNKKLQESEKQLTELNASKDKFFSIIAHDLKSPFTGYLGLTSILSEDIDEMSKDEIKEMAVALHNSTAHIYDLLLNLLNWSKVQGGLIDIHPELLVLNSVFETNIEVNKSNAIQKNIKIINNLENNVLVNFDKNIINTVLRNLIANAIKFTYPGGQVTLSAEKDNSNSITISVHDNGVGISKDTLDNLFRIDNQNRTNLGTANEKGTGLGLILCKELLEKCNTTLVIDTMEEKGSKFSFTVPLEQDL